MCVRACVRAPVRVCVCVFHFFRVSAFLHVQTRQCGLIHLHVHSAALPNSAWPLLRNYLTQSVQSLAARTEAALDWSLRVKD